MYKWGFSPLGLPHCFPSSSRSCLMVDGRRQASSIGGPTRWTYLTAAPLLSFIWCLYPVAETSFTQTRRPFSTACWTSSLRPYLVPWSCLA
ncbi:hypothetical protein B0H67DRAFT_561160 [Lasiosphaeris hirsuta]|uniref:Uncharacterized protein n=1 Tax=Lasiosphaeris hirsuta TaxID=260670 RepID=A0AA40B9Q2_9PEZI|nr:hypothetical protein B0H67DRAFT_561160 [Lasiosphaeris hirsuta]